MSLKDDASLILIPSAYKTGQVFMQKPLPVIDDATGNYDGTDPAVPTNLDFTRASEATRVNSEGLIEKVRTNLLLQSNTFNTTWALTNVTITGGQAGYDGGTDAWLFEKSAWTYISQNTSISSVNTFSIYAKAGTLSHLLLYVRNANKGKYFDLVNGTIGSDYVGSPIDAKIESVGNGWYRCSVTTDDATNNVRIYSASADNDTSSTSGSIYIQDAQLETGDIATDYIPTTSSAVSVGPVSNLPRLDYSGDATCPSLLLEPQRTNLVLFSEQFDNAAWTKLNATITANATTSPDGYQNADKLVEDTSSSTHRFISSGFSTTSGLSYTASIYAKQGERRYAYFRLNNSGGDLASGTIDLQTGVVTETANGTLSATVLSNGWVRITATGTSASTSAGYLELRTSNSATYSNYTGNGTSGIFAWGAQVELGSYPTSYIPTLGTAVTRLAETCSKTGMSSFIGQTEGTIFLEVDAVNFETDQRFSISDGTSANRIALRMSTGGVIQLSVVIGSTIQASITGSGSVGNTYKIAGAYKANDFVLYINGSLAGTDTSGSVGGTLSRFASDTGYGGSGQEFYNPIKQALLFPTRLPNATLASLTTL